MTEPVLLSWSGGKDSLLTLAALREAGVPVACLVTTVTEDVRRISMHGVRQALLERQAEALGLPLAIVDLPREADNDTFKRRWGETLARFRDQDIVEVAHGDLHLADVRQWREDFMASLDMRASFPIWGRTPGAVVEDFFALGARAWITCADTEQIDESFAGRALDRDTIAALPDGADPAGENGEYHSFVWDAPGLMTPVPCRPDGIVRRGQFAFCELVDA